MRAVPRTLALLLALCASVLTPVAHAERGSLATTAPLPKYVQECAACHLAYPPGLLPAASWQRVLGRLDRHYGTDASLDPASVQQIGAWLQANAATARRAREAPPQDRITRAAWFVREHAEVPAQVWQRPSIQSPANCAACHSGAGQGNFSEHGVHIPR
jgi:hypothetical protein